MSTKTEEVNQARIPESFTISKRQLLRVAFLLLNVAGFLVNGGYSASSLMESRKGSKAVTVEQLTERTDKLEKQAEETNKKIDDVDDKLDRIYRMLLPRRQSNRK